ncbi:DUF2280 domain-containing protein [Paraburkholderia unamae]|uniref:Phage terminase small subunit n=1 Tax=Paraburkholderia unamae TaxID=219649 RepID=A0ABX5K9T0_9BURK|nr:DUF2280 domain-containing protein [Paraburkholderia unamae]PVX61251.1 hypothetical protein C7402_14242 [Paraburkholderia unamae]
MAVLSDTVKTRITQALACFDTPSQVSKDILAEFGLVVTPQQCEAYDPTKRSGERLGKKYRAIFESTRANFLTDTSRIGIAHRAVRLRKLDRAAMLAEDRGNLPLMAQLLEQAAKEAGGAFTNKQKLEHTGKDGGPIKTAAGPVDLSDLTDDELDVLERIAAKREPGANPG